MSANEALEQFAHSAQSGVWGQILKRQLIQDMEQRIENPVQVNQGTTPLCGPAAIVFELVQKRPTRYVQIIQHLFEKGSFSVGGKAISASTTLRASNISSGMSPADWLLMATMREAENFIFDELNDDSWDIELGITTPWEMKGWAHKILGFSNVDFESTTLNGEFDAIRNAERAVQSGGVAFLLVHSAMMENDSPVVDYPDHWATYIGGLQITEKSGWDNGHVAFRCQTWGKIKDISLDEGPFEDGMWGVVTAV